jgi:hypothetical protein
MLELLEFKATLTPFVMVLRQRGGLPTIDSLSAILT